MARVDRGAVEEHGMGQVVEEVYYSRTRCKKKGISSKTHDVTLGDCS